MEGTRHGDEVWFLYDSWLFTDSPILKELYCESHRFEPWAVRGEELRCGSYRFENILTICAPARDALLAEIPEGLARSGAFAAALQERFRGKGLELTRLLRRLRRGERALGTVDRMLVAAAQVLSVGVIKEVLEPEDAATLLERFLPRALIRQHVLALYQPLCLPHFVKVEAGALWAASRYASCRSRAERARVIRACIDRVAHHSRFLLEPTELSAPAAMRSHLEQLVERRGPDPRRLLGERRRVLGQNRRARQLSYEAERQLLGALLRQGPGTQASRGTVMGILRTIQFVATWEELKHILVMNTAREVRRILERQRLPITTRTSELRARLSRAG